MVVLNRVVPTKRLLNCDVDPQTGAPLLEIPYAGPLARPLSPAPTT